MRSRCRHKARRRLRAHTVALIIIEASDQLSHRRLHQLVAASLPQLARFRSRLVAKPLGVGQPVWAEIDDYDPAPQLHSATIQFPVARRPALNPRRTWLPRAQHQHNVIVVRPMHRTPALRLCGPVIRGYAVGPNAGPRAGLLLPGSP